ncbi:hypothetical protein MMC14_009583 [Varicellaria rhodocarpa]|nr:hypothetical protein [Varicellaria rhodocarpa]
MSDPTCQPSTLVIPSTQNTAPVLEFRCLYSHDLRRKSKRWQDGFLRFHTFNKRVMVYDVPRNFIGDTHWREGDSVQDGDELELEKGVLIQVGEAVGTMHQDLTAILEKRKPVQRKSPNHRTSPYASPGYTARSLCVPLSQLRPKPLNSLLGTPRGAYGRAILPEKLPYQERQGVAAQDYEKRRPTKRQKLSTESPKNVDDTSELKLLKRRVSVILPIMLEDDDLLRKRSDCKRKEVITLLSDDEKLSVSSRPQKIGKPIPSIKQPQSKRSRKSDPSFPIQEDFSSNSQALHKAPTIPQVPRNRKSDNERPVNPLRFASSKPRKKLLYKDLLLQRPPSRSSQTRSGTSQQSNSRVLQENTIDMSSDDNLSKFSEESKLHRDVQFSDSEILSGDGRILDADESLFLTQSTVRDILEDGYRALDGSTRTEYADNQDIPSLREEYGLDSEASDTYALAEMDQLLLNHPHSNLLGNLHASSSISTAFGTTTLGTNGAEVKAPDSPFKKSFSESNWVRKPPKPLQSKIFLQRAASDMTGLRPKSKAPSRATALSPEKKDFDLGPWSREAFDLFGWRLGDDKRGA